MFSVALVGLGISALMVSVRSGTQVNAAGASLARATYLAQEVRERTLELPFSDEDPGDADNPPGPDGVDPQVSVDDLDDLMDVTYSPPRDATGGRIAGMDDWAQKISLTWRDPDDLSRAVAAGAGDNTRVMTASACPRRNL